MKLLDVRQTARSFLRRCTIPAVWSPDPTSPPEAGDAFCFAPSQGPRLIDFMESEHFRVAPSPLPLAFGHVLIVPKEHIRTYSEIPVTWGKELDTLIRIVRQFQKDMYGKDSFAREQGSPPGSLGNRQSIRHAHFHVIPINVSADEAADRIRELGTPMKKVTKLARYRLTHDFYHYVEVGDVARAMPDTGSEVEEAEMALRDMLGNEWDPVKMQPKKFEGQQADLMLADAVSKWNRWIEKKSLAEFELKEAKIRRIMAVPAFGNWQEFVGIPTREIVPSRTLQ